MNHTKGIIAVDNGGHSTCVCTKNTLVKFPSAKGEFRERKLISKHGKFDYVLELNNKKYMAGTLAQHESLLPLEMHTKSKQHLFYDLSILTAIHQFGYNENFVITCVPIFMHNNDEKDSIKKRLIGEWSFTVNDMKKQFVINDVAIAPETVVSFWVDEPTGKTRYVDWGSRTIGYGTVLNNGEQMRFIDSESGTFSNKGLEALSELNDHEPLVDYVAGRLLAKWNENDKVIHLGGGALNKNIINSFKQYFPNSVVHQNPQMAQAKGMMNLGRSVFDAIAY